MKYLLVLLLCFVMGCAMNTCHCRDGMVLLENNVKIVNVGVFKELSGDYISVDFENNHSALLPNIWGEEMRVGQTGCLYYIETFFHEETFVYYWQVLNE